MSVWKPLWRAPGFASELLERPWKDKFMTFIPTHGDLGTLLILQGQTGSGISAQEADRCDQGWNFFLLFL